MQICRECHFLSKQNFDDWREGNKKTPDSKVTKKERDSTKNENSYLLAGDEYNHIGCYHGVWKEDIRVSLPEDMPVKGMIEQLNKDRKGKCFFWQFDEGMGFPAAVELQKRENENEKLKKTLRLTICGLWIAVISSLLSAGVSIFGLILKCKGP